MNNNNNVPVLSVCMMQGRWEVLECLTIDWIEMNHLNFQGQPVSGIEKASQYIQCMNVGVCVFKSSLHQGWLCTGCLLRLSCRDEMELKGQSIHQFHKKWCSAHLSCSHSMESCPNQPSSSRLRYLKVGLSITYLALSSCVFPWPLWYLDLLYVGYWDVGRTGGFKVSALRGKRELQTPWFAVDENCRCLQKHS